MVSAGATTRQGSGSRHIYCESPPIEQKIFKLCRDNIVLMDIWPLWYDLPVLYTT
jgi:hypothetical protein